MSAARVVFMVFGLFFMVGGAIMLRNARRLSNWANNLERPWRSNVRNTPALWVVVGLLWLALGALGIILPITHK